MEERQLKITTNQATEVKSS